MTAGGALRWLLTSRAVAVGTASAVAAATSAVVTKRYLEKKIDEKYSALAQQEIHEAKLFYRQKYKEGEFSNPADLAKKYDEEEGPEQEEEARDTSMVAEAARLIDEQQYVTYSNLPGVETPKPDEPEQIAVKESIAQNIWETRDESTDENGINIIRVQEQQAKGLPYIISKDEFFTNEDDWSQTTLSWFDQDAVLADEADAAMNEGQPDKTVGLENLQFGVGSDDPNVVYIANPRFHSLYEVTRSTGSYSQEVLGEPFKSPKIRTRPQEG